MVQVGVEMGTNGACRVSCMLIAWTGALFNSRNVFMHQRLKVELLTIDLAPRASQVHYMGGTVLTVGSRASAPSTGSSG